MRINCVLNEIRVYSDDGCITVELHQSDNINVVLGPLLINTYLYLINAKFHAIAGLIKQ
jgi:hypothetical protein